MSCTMRLFVGNKPLIISGLWVSVAFLVSCQSTCLTNFILTISLKTLAARHASSTSEYQPTAAKLSFSLTNIRGILTHFSPKIEEFLTSQNISTPSEEQVTKLNFPWRFRFCVRRQWRLRLEILKTWVYFFSIASGIDHCTVFSSLNSSFIYRKKMKGLLDCHLSFDRILREFPHNETLLLVSCTSSRVDLLNLLTNVSGTHKLNREEIGNWITWQCSWIIHDEIVFVEEYAFTYHNFQ